MFNAGYILVFIAVILNVLGQIGFKHIAIRIKGRAISDLVDLQLIATTFLVGLSYGLAMVLWVIALTKVPLSKSYSIFALSFLLVPLAGIMIYGEDTNIWAVVLSFALILAAIIILNVLK